MFEKMRVLTKCIQMLHDGRLPWSPIRPRIRRRFKNSSETIIITLENDNNNEYVQLIYLIQNV